MLNWKVELRIVLVFLGVIGVIWAWPKAHPFVPPLGSASATPKPASAVAATVNDIQKALNLAAATRSAAIYVLPAASAIQKAVPGISAGDIQAIIHGLRQPTQPVYTVANTVKQPTVVPVPAASASVYDQAYAADVNASHDHPPTVDSNLTITQAPKPIGRIGTIISFSGAGIDYAVLRKGQFDVDLGLVTNSVQTHFVPVLAIEYMIPKTSVGCGPALSDNHTVGVGVACSIKI